MSLASAFLGRVMYVAKRTDGGNVELYRASDERTFFVPEALILEYVANLKREALAKQTTKQLLGFEVTP